MGWISISTWSAASLLLATALPWPGLAETAPIPPPLEQFQANCSSPTYASDMLVCETPELLELDQKMAQLLVTAGTDATTPSSQWIEGQSDWLRRRSMCAFKENHEPCLKAAYQERIAVLDAITNTAAGDVLDCRASAPFAKATIRRKRGGSLSIWDGKRLLAVAIEEPDPKVWKPYVWSNTRGRKIRFTLPDGGRTKCK